MKLLVLASVLSLTVAQRPMYAGSRPIGRPDLASRFKDTEAETSTVSFENRVGSDGSTIRVPTDARGDADLVNRLNQWPRENRPFWLLNADHIEKHRHPDDAVAGNTGPQQQSRFGGARSNQFDNVEQNRFENDYDDGINFGSRSNFDQFDSSVQARPVRPAQPRSSFLSSLAR